MRQETVVSQQPLSRVLGSNISKTVWQNAAPHRVAVVRGREAVSALQPTLIALSRRTGQIGAMDWLDHLLRSPSSLKKDPHVVLVGRQTEGTPGWSDVDSILGALLLYEYRFAELPTGVFATDDIYGTRTVLAPPALRFEVTQRAIAQLMRRNAAIVFVSLQVGEMEPPSSAIQGTLVAQRVRWIPTRLPLEATFDATLAQLGPRTRRNLRYYRRRAVAELGAHFVPDARITRTEFLALNCSATHPLPQEEAVWRHTLWERFSALPNVVCAGVRSAAGEWLSLIWGSRRDGVTEIEWQMNRDGASHHSFSVAMRAFLLEHEIMLGARELRFIGGTQHPMRAACTDTPVADILAVRRGSVRGWALRRFTQRLLPDPNFLRGALEDEDMRHIAPTTGTWAGA
jgi:hypothetical protein